MTAIALVAADAEALAPRTGRASVGHLAAALGAIGHQVVVFTRRAGGRSPDCVALAPNVVVRRLRAGPDGCAGAADTFTFVDEFAAGLRSGLSAHRIEIVHAHGWASGLASLLAVDGSGPCPPVVQTFHSLGGVERRHLGAAGTSSSEREAVEGRLAREADRVIALCGADQRELEALGCRGDRVSVVPVGFDGDVFHPPADARWFEVDRMLRPVELVSVDRLVPHAGLGEVLRAVAALPGVRLTVVGEPAAEHPGHATDLRELADALGVGERLRVVGARSPDGVAEHLRRADLFVAAPWFGPSGAAAVEAMGCGLPVVGTAVAGLVDTVVDGGTGALVPPRDPAALAATIDELARQPELRHELGARASWRAHRRFTWPTVARGVADVYRRTLAGRLGRECRA